MDRKKTQAVLEMLTPEQRRFRQLVNMTEKDESYILNDFHPLNVEYRRLRKQLQSIDTKEVKE